MESVDESVVSGVSLKKRKEEFVSNLHGTTMLEIAALSTVVPAIIILHQLYGRYMARKALQNKGVSSKGRRGGSRVEGSKQKGESEHAEPSVATLFTDIFFVGVPTLACLTVLADWIYVTTSIYMFLAGAGILALLRLNGPSMQIGLSTTSRQAFLSSFRFSMMLVTCISILAVDFRLFPRRYAKTEVYGTGLMDVGVGSFVVANGLVSKQARNVPPSKYGGPLRNASPLLLIGFSRLILTKGIDYQEHVAEFGVHWNFFFTLSAVALLTSLIRVPGHLCGALGLIILGVYQVTLSSGLNSYLLSNERGPGIISLNKEGIFSVFGYWSMYLMSVQLGQYLLSIPRISLDKKVELSEQKKADEARSPWMMAGQVWVLNGVLWSVAFLSDRFLERISRRTCNLAYVVFVFAMNLQIIAIFLTVDLLLPSRPMLLQRIFDRNMLATFLWGNILTGLLNLTVDTLSASPATAFLILVFYLVALGLGMALLEFHNVRVKFW